MLSEMTSRISLAAISFVISVASNSGILAEDVGEKVELMELVLKTDEGGEIKEPQLSEKVMTEVMIPAFLFKEIETKLQDLGGTLEGVAWYVNTGFVIEISQHISGRRFFDPAAYTEKWMREGALMANKAWALIEKGERNLKSLGFLRVKGSGECFISGGSIRFVPAGGYEAWCLVLPAREDKQLRSQIEENDFESLNREFNGWVTAESTYVVPGSNERFHRIMVVQKQESKVEGVSYGD